MSLLDSIKKEAPVAEAEGTGTVAKKSNSDYQKRQRELAAKYGKIVKEFVAKQASASAEVKEAANWLGREKGTGGNSSSFGKPVLYKLFGDAPKVGSKITALKVFQETGKGFAEMRQLMKKWLTKQYVEVVYDESAQVYTIKSGDIPAYTK